MKRCGKILKGRLALSVLACSLILTACGNRADLGKPSDSRLMCAAEPAIPDPGPDGRISDEAASEYVVKLRDAWFSCYNALTWLRAFYATP